jgi:ribosome-associated protein
MSKSSEFAIASQNQYLTESAKSTIDPQELALQVADAAADKKAADIVLLNVSEVSYLADYFVIITGFSRAQLNAISESIEERLEEKYNLLPARISGRREGGWIVQDYTDVIVHIFLPEEREYYNLEAFWGHAERHEFSQPS